MAKISISFKNNVREQKLYDYFNNLEDKSGDIKKILMDWYVVNVKRNKQQEKSNINNNFKNDIRDF